MEKLSRIFKFSLSNKRKIGFFWPLKVGSNLKGTINFIGDSANTKIYLVDSTS